MKAIEKFAKGKGLELKPMKVRDSPASINSAAKQKELLIQIATGLGYLQ